MEKESRKIKKLDSKLKVSHKQLKHRRNNATKKRNKNKSKARSKRRLTDIFNML